ncbi:MAG TPA: ABC transporter ATP-binding protein [Anaerolineaceae bacterium]|nr:ABC transporter ATP-binding protein [Anaerolineaceae bacterium]
MAISEVSIPFRYKTKRSSAVSWVASHALRHWYIFLVGIIGAIGNAALASVPALQYGLVFENLTSGNPSPSVFLRAGAIVGISQVSRGFLQFFRNFGFEVTAQRIERDVRDEFYISLLGKSMTFHSLQSVGDLMARATNDIREVNYIFSPGLNTVLGSINFLFIPLGIAVSIHPALLLTPVLFIIFYFLSIAHFLKILEPVTREVRSTFGTLNSRLAEDIDGVETVKAASQEKAEIDRFKANSQAFRDANVKQGDIEARFIPLLLLALAMGFGLLHALILYRQGLIPLSSVITFFSGLSMLGFPTNSSIRSYSQISLGLASARRLLSTMNSENNLDQNESGHSGVINGKVNFENVSFAYDGNNLNLQDITFQVNPGQTVAIVGQTGSGKTSLVRLINRTYDPLSGSVKIDGIDLRDWKLDSLRGQISIIEQDIFLFSKSVAENIAFGKPNATLDEIIMAAKKAQANGFIEELPEGYDTVIGERGATISGGQRQRLALARAFLTDPKILILDDSTSAIDSKTEDEIQRAIKLASEGRTTFIITHRLSQIRWADLIIVMRKGRISAIGTHNQLMETSKSYRNIFAEAKE